MSCTMSWARQEPSTPGYTGCYGCGEHDHRHAECMQGETQETQREEKARRVVMSKVANLIASGGARMVLEKLRAVFGQGGDGGDVGTHTMHQPRRWETVSEPWTTWEAPQKKQSRQLDEKAKRRYGAHRRIRTARKKAEKARQAQAVLEALPLPKAIQRAAARKTEVWEAKVESRLQEQKKTLSKQQPSRSTLVDELWLEKQGREESSRQNEHWRKRRRQAQVSRAKSSRSEQRRRTRTDQQGRGAMRELHCHCQGSRW